ncbi:MAG: hypothetical protein IJ588_12435 [Prevotella sp.]|nr:hypothetical protein [Prevotella sp.]
MEEKKKRVRPTVAQVRALEARVAELENLTAARDRALVEAMEELKGVKTALLQARECSDSAIHTLEQSNALMEQELKLRESKIALLEEVADNRAAEVERLKGRGFWARVFNR